MKISMRVTLETPDGDKTDLITCDARDLRNYESEFQASWVTTDLSFTQMTQLAYVTMKRAGKFAGSYDVFDSQCSDVEHAETEVEADRPTRRSRGGGS